MLTALGLVLGRALAPIGAALRPFVVPLIAATACLIAGWYVLDMRDKLTTATAANRALTEQLATADAFNTRLASSVDRQAASAELFGRRDAALQTTLAATLESLTHEPDSTVCLASPLARLGLDGMRAQRAAFDAAQVHGEGAGDTAHGP